jgi:tetratricopeptide (TPR) repeat protein
MSAGNAEVRAAAGARLASLRRFLEAEPGNTRLRRDVVDTAVAAGEFEYVRELAEKRLSAAPADAEAQFDRATALMGLKDYAGAIQVLTNLDQDIGGVRFNIGLSHFLKEQYALAGPFLQSCYDAGDRTGGLLRVLLLTRHHLGDLDAALAIVQANEALIGSNAELAGHAAMLYLDDSQSARGEAWAQRALALDPQNADALVADGLVRTERLDTAGAQAAFEHALSRSPEYGRAWIGLGSLTMMTKDFSKAGEQIERGLRALPTHLGSWQLLGWNYLFAQRLDDAERIFNHALELNRNFAESHGGLASVAALRGDRANAERLMEVAERLDPARNSSKFARAVLAGQEGGDEVFKAAILQGIESIPGPGRQLAAMIRRSRAKG